MKIGVGYRNGIGNFIIFTSILRCLVHHSGEPVDVLLEEEWEGETKEAVALLASNLSFVDKVVSFPSQFDPPRYDRLYMSTHSGYGPLLSHILGAEALNPDKIVTWGEDFYHERDHYLFEIMDQFGYKGPIFDQDIGVGAGEKFFSLTKRNSPLIAISNGYLRSASEVWKKKTYGRWEELLTSIAQLYSSVCFVVLGGEEDKEWAESLCGSLSGHVRIYNLAGVLNILQTASLIRQSDLLISTDTGVFHIADALNVPGVVLFGPTLVSKNGPLNGSMVPLQTSLECGGCQSTIYLKACSEAKCMDAISPSVIVSLVREIIGFQNWSNLTNSRT